MTEEEFSKLQIGDIIRHKTGTEGYVVLGNYGDRVLIVRAQNISNPEEWNLIIKKSVLNP